MLGHPYRVVGSANWDVPGPTLSPKGTERIGDGKRGLWGKNKPNAGVRNSALPGHPPRVSLGNWGCPGHALGVLMRSLVTAGAGLNATSRQHLALLVDADWVTLWQDKD